MSSAGNFWSFLGSLAWPALIAAGAYYCRHQLRELFELLVSRLKAGATVKIASVEIGPIAFADPGGTPPSGPHTHHVQRSMEVSIDGGTRRQERDQIYDATARLFLAHRLRKSENSRYDFDITIYLIAHKEGSTLGIKSVDYYFGSHWGDQVFRVTSRHNSFAILTSAFGPFLCTAVVTLNDDTTLKLSRYIDFEMGDLASATTTPPKQD